MGALKPEYHDREILERVAEIERNSRPFEYSTSGVTYEDLMEFFEYDDFGNPPLIMLPNRLKYMSNNGYLNQVYSSGSSANATYRLAEPSWSIVDTSHPKE